MGDFGTLLYAGKDRLDRDRRRRCTIPLAGKALARGNDAIGAGTRQAAE